MKGVVETERKDIQFISHMEHMIMNLKLLIFLTWLFFVIERHTSDDLWFGCMIYCGILAICAYFYRKENSPKPAAKHAESENK